MKGEQFVFQITIKRRDFEVQKFYVVGDGSITKSELFGGIAYKFLDKFVTAFQHGGGAYGTDWKIETVENIGTVCDLDV